MKKTIKSFKSLTLIMCSLFYLIGTNGQMINTNPSGTMTSSICGNAQEYQKVFEMLKAKGFRPTKVPLALNVPKNTRACSSLSF